MEQKPNEFLDSLLVVARPIASFKVLVTVIIVHCDREIATDYSFTCLLRFMSVVVCLYVCVREGHLGGQNNFFPLIPLITP
jgi:hypothetical protein